MVQDESDSHLSQDRLLAATKSGDSGAFDVLVAPYADRLRLHAYRMLGSFHDAEDALQETLLRAWLSIERFEERSSVGTWLHQIATNVCLNLIRARPRLVLPAGSRPSSRPPAADVPWLEPFPDLYLPTPLEDGPEARVEAREATRLAIIAMLQLLPARQRAVLVLRDVLAWSSTEVAAALETTVPAVNSALQRARARLAAQPGSVRSRSPALVDEQEQATIDTWIAHWEAADIDGLVRLLTDDAVLAMPPAPAWFSGRPEIAAFLRTGPNGGRLGEIRIVATRANGQPALAAYLPQPDGSHLAYGVMVIDVVGDRIGGFTGFSDARLVARFGLPVALAPDDR